MLSFNRFKNRFDLRGGRFFRLGSKHFLGVNRQPDEKVGVVLIEFENRLRRAVCVSSPAGS